MAFRSEAKHQRLVVKSIVAMALLFGACTHAATFEVRHKHARKGAPGVLEFTETLVSFRETGKQAEHSREWKYEDIQQLTLSPDGLRILTYEDQKWQFGRDQEYLFDQVPKDMAAQLYPMLRSKMDQRFSANVADAEIKPLWSLPAKLTQGRSGSQGVLTVGEDRIVYETDKGISHTWRYSDIENISTSGPFDFSILALQRLAWHHGSPSTFHFQLKRALQEDQYHDLWLRLQRLKGLQVLSPSLPGKDAPAAFDPDIDGMPHER
ncbi:MAG: hypothetical protein ABL995_13015 [Bryobacteraceae bacterium]